MADFTRILHSSSNSASEEAFQSLYSELKKIARFRIELPDEGAIVI